MLTNDIVSYIILRMKIPVRANQILKKIRGIQLMERGKLCRMAGRPHYNLQSWQKGRNVVRYVPREQLPLVRQAIQGYKKFMALAQDYASEIIKQTRKQQSRTFRKSNQSKRKYVKKRKST